MSMPYISPAKPQTENSNLLYLANEDAALIMSDLI